MRNTQMFISKHIEEDAKAIVEEVLSKFDRSGENLNVFLLADAADRELDNEPLDPEFDGYQLNLWQAVTRELRRRGDKGGCAGKADQPLEAGNDGGRPPSLRPLYPSKTVVRVRD